MDASRSVHAAPLRAPGTDFCTANQANLISNLRVAAFHLAEGRINRRDRWTRSGIVEEFFCMECREVQTEGQRSSHRDWCKAGRVMDAVRALEAAEAVPTGDGPGVDGFTPLHLAQSEAGAR